MTPDDWTRLVAEAGRLPTATLHEAYGRAGDLPHVIKPVHRTWRVAGRAYAVSCPTGNNLHIHHAIYNAEPGDVLVVDVGDGPDFGYWGEILSEAALSVGLGGLVIAGCVRDHDEIVDVGFPIFSSGLCIRGTEKATAGGTIGSPVTIGRVTVRTGDLVIGDADGVVVIARDDVPRVVEAAAQRELKEKDFVEAIKNGATTLDLYQFPALESDAPS